MRLRPSLALAAVVVLGACAPLGDHSAFAPGPWVERDGASVLVRYSTGGGVFATAIDLGRIREAGGRVVIDGDCLSACTLALMDVVASTVCWTSGARFAFHAAHVNGRLHADQTASNLASMPAAVRAALPRSGDWSVARWYVLAGDWLHAALGRGNCGRS